MKHLLGRLLALGLSVCVATCVWAIYDDLPSASGERMLANDVVPGRLWAYRVSIPFENLDSVALEIRRSSTPHGPGYTAGHVNGGLVTSREDSEKILSTAQLSSTQMSDGLSVATWLVELDDLMSVPPAPDQWCVAGNIGISGVSSSISPQEDFCLGKVASTAWEQTPDWNGNEICVGRFRTQDDERIYDYCCVVVAAGVDAP